MNDYYILSGLKVSSFVEEQISLYKNARWIGVDRGAHLLIQQGIQPYLAIGDFDSVSLEEKQTVEKYSRKMIELPADKNYTDTEEAVLAVLRENRKANVYLLNESKSRLDHFISILWLPVKEEFRAYAEQIYFFDSHNKVSYYLPGDHRIKKEENKSVISFGNLLPIKELTLTGFEYPLTQEDISAPTMYTSNKFLNEEGSFSFDQGLLMVIQSADN
ncbi:MAG: thiamine diphosphokinase [Atopococcus tabaci]|uniref:Thiamine diphosphokinase n=1 Tax=Atopococcus tabaci TaxID=269774 RepID=A0AA43U783_9LACT|nr:thiamine diphosphokinase [Atopococcus tabaci]